MAFVSEKVKPIEKNRPIKFRAWDNVNRRMYSHQLEAMQFAKNGNPANIAVSDFNGPLICIGEDAQCVLMQFTGLLDKNGKEMFEGDFLKDGKGQVGQVLWAHNSYLIEWQERDHRGHRTYQTMTDDCFGYGEVIGNIYQNPELLK